VSDINSLNSSAVEVSVRKFKTGAFQRGVTICLALSTASGFLIGQTLQIFIHLLLGAGYPPNFPLFMSLVDVQLTFIAH